MEGKQEAKRQLAAAGLAKMAEDLGVREFGHWDCDGCATYPALIAERDEARRAACLLAGALTEAERYDALEQLQKSHEWLIAVWEEEEP